MREDLLMNSDELKHNEVPEGHLNREHAVAPQAPASSEANRLLPFSTQSSAPTQTSAEARNTPAAKLVFSKRGRIAVAIIGLAVVAGLLLGFLPRWRQSRSTATDTSQLAIPSVSVVSATPGTNRGGLALPAEVRPWLEASIFARANGYLK